MYFSKLLGVFFILPDGWSCVLYWQQKYICWLVGNVKFSCYVNSLPLVTIHRKVLTNYTVAMLLMWFACGYYSQKHVYTLWMYLPNIQLLCYWCGLLLVTIHKNLFIQLTGTYLKNSCYATDVVCSQKLVYTFYM